MASKINIGDRFSVKLDNVTRDGGLRCSNTGDRQDSRAMPGEIGVIVSRSWTASTTGEAMSGLWLEFSRGRSIALDGSGKFFADVRGHLRKFTPSA